MSVMDVEDLLNLAGRLKEEGEPFARPVLSSSMREDDPESSFLLLMAYKLYKAVDHARADFLVDLSGYGGCRVCNVSGPPDEALRSAQSILSGVAPTPPVEVSSPISPMPSTPAGNVRSWKVAYDVARAGSVLYSNGFSALGKLIADVAEDLIVGNVNPAKDKIPQVCRVISEAFTGELVKKKIVERLGDAIDMFGDEDAVVNAVREVKEAVERLEYDAVVSLQPVLQHIADAARSEPIDHPKRSDYIIGPYLRTPEVAGFTERPPVDPDKLERYVENLMRAFKVVEDPVPAAGARGVEVARSGSVVDLCHWLVAGFRAENVPTACYVKCGYGDSRVEFGLRYWRNTDTSYVLRLYPDVEVVEPDFTTQKGINPCEHDKVILEAPELPV